MNVPTDMDMRSRNVKLIAVAAVVIIIGGIILAWLTGQGYLPAVREFIEPAAILGITILTASILICCTASLLTGSYASKIPEYGEMEIVFEKAKEHYDAEEWEEALEIFQKLMGPNMDHKRALYYGAMCCEKLGNTENVIRYLRRYVELQPKDKEVWEILARAHKRLFQYEEANEAEQKAMSL